MSSDASGQPVDAHVAVEDPASHDAASPHAPRDAADLQAAALRARGRPASDREADGARRPAPHQLHRRDGRRDGAVDGCRRQQRLDDRVPAVAGRASERRRREGADGGDAGCRVRTRPVRREACEGRRRHAAHRRTWKRYIYITSFIGPVFDGLTHYS